MDFWDVIRKQRMTRRFEPEAPPRQLVDRVLAAARSAPSAGNTQSVSLLLLEGEQAARFWALTRPEARARLTQLPPVIVLPMVSKQEYLARYAEPDKRETGRDREDGWPQPYWLIDCAFAAMTILLAATAEGLGCWFFGIYAGEDALKVELGIPREQQLIGAIGLGYPVARQVRSPSLARGRKPIEQFIRRGQF